LGAFIVAAGALLWGGGAVQAMSFRLVQLQDPRCGRGCPPIIAAEGEITPGTTARFVEFTRQAMDRGPVSNLVLINSPGGVVIESLTLGMVLREIGASVAVARAGGQGLSGGTCYSACVYALMGGSRRIAPPGSRLGVHRAFMGRPGQHRGPARGARPPAGLTSAMRQYARAMGVDPAVISIAERTPSNSIHKFRAQELSRLRLAR
jgi:hypothetical protein